MNAQHTPGPWFYRTHPNDFAFEHVANQNGAIVAKPMRMGSERVMEANARLIAAAPDLLAALRDLLGSALTGPLNDDNGRCCHCGRDNSEHLDHPCSDDCPGEIARAAIAKAEGR